MIVKGTYFQNDAERPRQTEMLRYGIYRDKDCGEKKKRTGFLRKVCSSDFAEPIIR